MLARVMRAMAAVSAGERVLDIGCGCGESTREAARAAKPGNALGVDLSVAMLKRARDRSHAEGLVNVRFEQADAAQLPYEDDSFELVSLVNMIPFFDELERVAAPGGHVVFSFSSGPETPIWVPPERLRAELGSRGFADFAEIQAGGGTALLARKGSRG